MKSIWLKSFILICAFGAVVYTIYNLKHSDTLEKGLQSLTYNPKSDRVLTWCETRVDEIEVPGKFRMYQEGLEWFRQTPDGITAKLGFVPVEKWFSEYCKLRVEGMTKGLIDASTSTVQVIARVGFIKGPDKNFLSIDTDLYAWDQWTFRSEALKNALKDLEDLPKIGGSEKGTAPGH